MATQSVFSSLPLPLIMEDLASRFIVNLPPSELQNISRVMFQIEEAHWFYLDRILPLPRSPDFKPLQPMGFKNFTRLLLKSCQLFEGVKPEDAIEQFLRYKGTVPVAGAILVDKDWAKVLLVKGYKSGSSWGFPKGKINYDETMRQCAVREVKEEIGFDINPLLPEDGDPMLEQLRLTSQVRDQRVTLYIVTGVDHPEEEFVTHTKQEIGEIRWFPLSQLPGWSARKNGNGGNWRDETGPTGLKCFNVATFVSQLREWISRNKPSAEGTKKSNKPVRLKFVPSLEPNEPSSAVDSPVDPKLFSNILNKKKIPPHMLQAYRQEKANGNASNSEKDRNLQEYFFGNSNGGGAKYGQKEGKAKVFETNRQVRDERAFYGATPSTSFEEPTADLSRPSDADAELEDDETEEQSYQSEDIDADIGFSDADQRYDLLEDLQVEIGDGDGEAPIFEHENGSFERIQIVNNNSSNQLATSIIHPRPKRTAEYTSSLLALLQSVTTPPIPSSSAASGFTQQSDSVYDGMSRIPMGIHQQLESQSPNTLLNQLFASIGASPTSPVVQEQGKGVFNEEENSNLKDASPSLPTQFQVHPPNVNGQYQQEYFVSRTPDFERMQGRVSRRPVELPSLAPSLSDRERKMKQDALLQGLQAIALTDSPLTAVGGESPASAGTQIHTRDDYPNHQAVPPILAQLLHSAKLRAAATTESQNSSPHSNRDHPTGAIQNHHTWRKSPTHSNGSAGSRHHQQGTQGQQQHRRASRTHSPAPGHHVGMGMGQFMNQKSNLSQNLINFEQSASEGELSRRSSPPYSSFNHDSPFNGPAGNAPLTEASLQLLAQAHARAQAQAQAQAVQQHYQSYGSEFTRLPPQPQHSQQTGIVNPSFLHQVPGISALNGMPPPLMSNQFSIVNPGYMMSPYSVGLHPAATASFPQGSSLPLQSLSFNPVAFQAQPPEGRNQSQTSVQQQIPPTQQPSDLQANQTISSTTSRKPKQDPALLLSLFNTSSSELPPNIAHAHAHQSVNQIPLATSQQQASVAAKNTNLQYYSSDRF